MLNNVTTVRGYAIHLGLDPTDRAVIRKIQRQCERGDLDAVLDQGTWLIKVPHKNEGAIIMRNWENMKEVYFEGMTLTHAGFAGGKSYGLNNNKVSLFYVNRVQMKHFDVTWDFTEFLTREESGRFEWPSPHAVMPLEEDRKQSVVDYFSGLLFTPYGREVEFNGDMLTIINRPVEFAPTSGALRYYAGAIDHKGNVYQIYWNVFNMFEPSEIEMTVDKGRYCKHCLKHWMASADNSKCKHEWIAE
ncbi:hypothetical protein ACQKK5_07725 [Brevibacillus panacihumi]|uniref:hypothetical protein n=1 Tax=Brevibacillus panacihumi TaxID=497735 RepID=UPI003D062E9F